MTIYQIAWTLVTLEILIFLAWLYSLIFPGSGADAAGKGLGQAFTLALGVYMLINLGLMLPGNRVCTILAAIMACLPVIVTVFGLLRWWKTR